MQNSIRIVVMGCLLGLLAGCSFFSVYKRDIPQGNLVSESMVSQLKVGMTREQVVYVMGNPLLDNAFDANEWDYIYQVHKADGKVVSRRVSITFHNGLIGAIDKEGVDNSTITVNERPAATESTSVTPQISD
ncbi:outer membrane protein assembly factor BamE [Zymobacter palmae]|nr:outer membrane protein assembly factor BamE [Zymobacter palmae]